MTGPTPDDPWCVRCKETITGANKAKSKLLRWCICEDCRTWEERGLKMASPFENTCLHCKHFYFDFGSPTYSEFTPGYPGTVECRKDKFELYGSGYDDKAERHWTLRELFTEHLSCDKFERED